MSIRKSPSIPKSRQRAPPAGTLAKEAAEETVYYCGQFIAWPDGKAPLRLNSSSLHLQPELPPDQQGGMQSR